MTATSSLVETSAQGSTFKVTLPAGDVAPALSAPRARLPLSSAREDSFQTAGC